MESMQISVYLLLNFDNHYLALSRDESDQCVLQYSAWMDMVRHYCLLYLLIVFICLLIA